MPGPSPYNRKMKQRADRERRKQNIRGYLEKRKRWRRYGPQGDRPRGARTPNIRIY